MKHLHSKPNPPAAYGAALLLLGLSLLLGIAWGATTLDFGALSDPASADALIFRYARLPRVLGSALCGGALAVSGAVIQGVLANRLASPSIIGVNAGAGLAVTVAAVCGIAGGWQLSLLAFTGAFAAVMAVSLGAKKWGASRGTVILMGVALNSLLGALTDGITALHPEAAISRSAFRMGDFSAVTYPKLIPAGAVILLSILLLQTLSSELDVLALGDDCAKGLGMNTTLTRTLLLLLSAALAGAAVSMAGLLSFVGLLIPHALRRMGWREARHLIPLCALLGGGFVSLCDTLSRTLFAPYELPVGILLAFLGAPCFLAILLKGKGGKANA